MQKRTIPNSIEFYKSNKITADTLQLMLDAPAPTQHQSLMARITQIQKISQYIGNDFIKKRIFVLRSEKNKIHANFQKLHRKLVSEGYGYEGEGKYSKSQGLQFDVSSSVNNTENYLQLEKYSMRTPIYILAYEDKNNTRNHLKWNEDELHALLQLLTIYIKKADVNELLDIYTAHIHKGYINQHNHVFSFFSDSYPTIKIKFIELIQHQAVLSLNDISNMTNEELYVRVKQIAAHPLFSATHLNHGVKQADSDLLHTYLKGMESICIANKVILHNLYTGTL